MGQQKIPMDGENAFQSFGDIFCFALICGAGVLVLYIIVSVAVSIACAPPYRGPDYMVSITGVDGLNQEATSGGVGPTTTLSPVFNITVRIDNSGNEWNRACVWGLSTAVVSYGDAFLARGSVPPFCAEMKEVQERVATAWGDDVVLPRFLRERLSAELERGVASLDVQVTMPAGSFGRNDRVLVCSKVEIGGSSPPPCRVEEVYPRPQPAPGAAGYTS